ncbi:hypothetical protein ACFZCG_21670 [Streptomyces tanashiensis]|uniref:hypothetical protein n=1 Tax=Streptomyces tanashiensis TaxID=67367 RepID=UPI0036E0954A
MPDTTGLDQATSMIEKAWAQPIEVLEVLAARRPCDAPLLRSAMHIRPWPSPTTRRPSTRNGCTP